ncbi:MAG: response regulator transcription factor [Clostridium sp.]|nr:response regulator transcription factor [Clostridium sp.]
MANDPRQTQSPAESILVIDEEVIACELLQYKLQQEGFRTDVCHSGEDALKLPLGEYNLILVDLMSKPFNGLKFTEAVKRNPDFSSVPIIFISARADEDDIVAGLDAGADDYVQKPFSARELVARVRSVLRRRRMLANRRLSNILRYKQLQVDMGAGLASIAGQPVSLTRIEHNLLSMFLRHRNQFFDRSEIRLEAWDENSEVSDRTVDVNISRLRKKLGEYGSNIVNRQGYGYGFIE